MPKITDKDNSAEDLREEDHPEYILRDYRTGGHGHKLD